MLSDSRFEYTVCLLLGHVECREAGGRQVSFKGRKVETFVVRKCFIGGNFGGQEQVLLIQSSFWKRNEPEILELQSDNDLLRCGVSFLANGARTSSIIVSRM